MHCPACNRPIQQTESADGTLHLWCPDCGWGAGDAEAPARAGRAAPVALWKLVLLWVAAVLVVVGPYCALRFGVPVLFDIGLPRAEEVHARYLALLDGWYWLILAFYLAAAGLFTPTYDPENLGFFGGFMDNPFSFEDDWNRTKRTWLFLLLPGKVVWVALKLTWYRLRG